MNNNGTTTEAIDEALLVAHIAAVLLAHSEAFVYTKAMAVRDALELIQEAKRQLSEQHVAGTKQ